jgi:hypothetical protein
LKSLRMSATVLALVASLGVASASGANTTAPVVTSTLDGKRVLPFRTHWIANPHLPAAQVKEPLHGSAAMGAGDERFRRTNHGLYTVC